MGSLRVVRMRPPGRWAVTFYRAFRTSARRSVYARVRSLSMEQIGARELRANLAAALRQAGAGERVVVTVDGRPVAQLGPLEPSGTPSLRSEERSVGKECVRTCRSRLAPDN